MAIVFIPSLLRKHTNEHEHVVVQGSTVKEIINNLDDEFPGIKDRLVDGLKLKPNVSVAVDGQVTTMGLLEKVEDGSEVHFLPALGGGQANNVLHQSNMSIDLA